MKKRLIKIFAVAIALCTVALGSVFALSACDKTRDDVFKRDTVFTINDGSNEGDPTTIMDFPYGFISSVALNDEQCYFRFGSDGMLHAQLRTADNLMSMVDSLLGNVDLGAMLDSLDLGGMVRNIVQPFFPGFTLNDLQYSLSLIEKSLGFNIRGLDFEDEGIKYILDYVKQHEKLPGDVLQHLPEDLVLTLTFDNPYSIRTVHDADGNAMQAIYIGRDVANDPTTQPFAVMTLREKNGVKTIYYKIEFMNVVINLTEKTV